MADETGRPVQPPMPVFAEATTIYVEMNDTKLAIGQAKQAAGLTPANDEKPPEVTLSASTDGDRWPHARPPRKDDTTEDDNNNISYPPGAQSATVETVHPVKPRIPWSAMA